MQAVGRCVVAHVDDLGDRGDLAGGGELGDHGSEIGVDEKQGALAVLKPERDLGRRQAGVDGNENAAGPHRGIEKLEIAIAVEREDRGTVAGLEAEPVHRRGEPGDTVADFAPGVFAPAVEGGAHVRFDLDQAFETLGQIHWRIIPQIVVLEDP